MLSMSERSAVERFVKFLNEDEDCNIKYVVDPIVRGCKIWGMKVTCASIACEKMDTTVKVVDMIYNFDKTCERILSLTRRLERNIFELS